LLSLRINKLKLSTLSRVEIFHRQAEKSCPELATMRRRGHPEAEGEERLTESLDSIYRLVGCMAE
jgi:hypothetical protein